MKKMLILPVPDMPEAPTYWTYQEKEAWKAGWFAGYKAMRDAAHSYLKGDDAASPRITEEKP